MSGPFASVAQHPEGSGRIPPSTDNCPACRAPLRYWARKADHQLRICLECRTVAAGSSESPGAVSQDPYASYHALSTFEAPALIAESLAVVVASAEPYRRTNRWLDFGFGEGALLTAAEQRSWSCYGIEASPHALEYGRSRGWRVADAAAGKSGFAVASFDVVSMIEVIEHLPEPTLALREALHWLRPGGLLYLTTPNARSLNRWVLGSEWSIFCPPEHWIIWSPLGLRRALQCVGFTGVRMRTTGLNPVEILARLRRPKAPGPPVHRQAAAVRLNEALSRSPSRRLVKRLANELLTALQLGDGLKAWCEKPE
jgi:2-polyprenyl-3-methyl-5-hydroxy-6-metoxy-1,4-benzoquinol methylase